MSLSAPPPTPATPRLIAGIQAVREAIRVHGDRLGRVVVSATQSDRLDALARFAKAQQVPVERLARGQLDRLSGGLRHQGVLAFAPELELLSLDALAAPSDAAIIALDAITDPQNFGAVVRSSVAIGQGAVLFGEHHAAPLSAATFRASAGAVEHAQLCRTRSLRGAVQALGQRGLSTIALCASATTALSDVDLCGPVVVVVGSEEKGVRRGVRRVCSIQARLPMSGPLDSLNASVAAAIALYEIARQRSAQPASAPED